MKTTLEFNPKLFGSHVTIRVNLKGLSTEQLHKKAKIYIDYFTNNDTVFELGTDCTYTLYFNEAIDNNAPHVRVNYINGSVASAKYKLIIFPDSKS